MAKILVTGGAGFIGGALSESLLRDNNKVDILDDFTTGKKNNLPISSKFNLINCNLNNFSDFRKKIFNKKYDYIFHYAALVGVERTIKNPILVLKDIDGFKNIFEYAAKTRVKRILFSSSSEVYGEPVDFPQNEHSTPLNSKLPYAVTKNVGECFCKAFKKKYNLNYNIFRFFNTYGKNQSKDFVISKFINFCKKNQNITIYGNGKQTRTFCYIDDNVDATIKILNSKKLVNNIVNIGNDKEISMYDLAKKIKKITKSSSKIKFLPALEEGDMTRRKPDIKIMKSVINRKLISLTQGLKTIIN